jgi:uncharacterized protein YecA (UPF0149 family)
MDHEFTNLCVGGDLMGAQQWLQINPNIDISNYEILFGYICGNGKLDVAQWLLQVFKEQKQHIDISIETWAFVSACQNGFLHVAQWLQRLHPYLYEINYDETDTIIHFRIRDEEDVNWERRKYGLFLSTNKKEPNLLYQLPTDVAKIAIQFI